MLFHEWYSNNLPPLLGTIGPDSSMAFQFRNSRIQFTTVPIGTKINKKMTAKNIPSNRIRSK